MADIRDLRTRFYEAIRDWLIDCNWVEEELADVSLDDDEIFELVDKLIVLGKYHKGVK